MEPLFILVLYFGGGMYSRTLKLLSIQMLLKQKGEETRQDNIIRNWKVSSGAYGDISREYY